MEPTPRVIDPSTTPPIPRALFNLLTMSAEVESDRTGHAALRRTTQFRSFSSKQATDDNFPYQR